MRRINFSLPPSLPLSILTPSHVSLSLTGGRNSIARENVFGRSFFSFSLLLSLFRHLVRNLFLMSLMRKRRKTSSPFFSLSSAMPISLLKPKDFSFGDIGSKNRNRTKTFGLTIFWPPPVLKTKTFSSVFRCPVQFWRSLHSINQWSDS